MNIRRSGAILLALPLLLGECLLVHEVRMYYCAMLKAYSYCPILQKVWYSYILVILTHPGITSKLMSKLN